MRARVAVACGISPNEVADLTAIDYLALVRVLTTERNREE